MKCEMCKSAEIDRDATIKMAFESLSGGTIPSAPLYLCGKCYKITTDIIIKTIAEHVGDIEGVNP